MLDESFKAAMRQHSGNGFLNAAEERALYVRIQAGDASATRELIEANYPLLVQVASQELRPVAHAFTLMDLVQDGYFGLERATKYFNPNLGRFSTIATRCIRQAILKEIAKKVGPVRATVKARSGNSVRLKPIQAALIHCVTSSEAVESCSCEATETPAMTPALEIALRRAVANLPRQQRALIHYVYFRRDTLKEAARCLGITPGTAKRRMTAALAALAAVVEGIDGEVEARRPELVAAG